MKNHAVSRSGIPSLSVGLGLSWLCWGLLTGCTTVRTLYVNDLSPARLDRGYTIVLPGIEGASLANGNIARGLEAAQLNTAIEVDDWTTGMLPMLLLHLRWEARNRRQAERIVEKIIQYQDDYPGRPVSLVGHSAGAGMSLMVLEALPADRKIDTVILLAPAISPRYKIDAALAKTRRGIWNFYSPLDIPLLVVGTTLAGTVDGHYMPSAGACGFTGVRAANSADAPQLHQIGFSPRMMLSQNLGDHFGCCNPLFIKRHIAPVLREEDSESR